MFDPSKFAYVPTRIKVKPRDRGWITLDQLTQSTKAIAVRADILDRLRQHEREDTLPRGGRGIFYDLRPHGMPGASRGIHYLKEYTAPKDRQSCHTEATPGYVTDQLSSMRRVYDVLTGEWLVPEEWIADNRSPDPSKPFEVEDAKEAAHDVVGHLTYVHLARQAGQDAYLEIQCEAANLIQRVARIAGPYGVPVYSGGGMDGLKGKKEAAKRAAGRDVPTLIGHLADFDLKGGDIRDAFSEDVIAFTRWHQDYEDAPGSAYIAPLGLTLEQATEHDLLDSNGKAEVEGLPIPVLDALVKTFIETHMDLEILEEVKRAEPKMRSEAAKIAQRRLKKPS